MKALKALKSESLVAPQIQERRCEAILKRLRSQLKKAQSGHLQLRSDVTHLQTQLDELRGQMDRDGISD